jgi:Rps23 Pro-64 3,4-dihydroxylase Tpa1-like proline 4-hydroxylase
LKADDIVEVIRIDNFLTDIEMGDIYKELLKLDTSLHKETEHPKNNVAVINYSRVYIDKYYSGNRDKSDIIRIIHDNLFNEKTYSEIPLTEELLKMIPLSDNSECQYTVYPVGGSYSWHLDAVLTDGHYSRPFRIANYIYYTNDDFDGGELHISYKKDVDITKKNCTDELVADLIIVPKKNTLIIMPSDAWHTVTPVTKGERRTVNGHIGFRT